MCIFSLFYFKLIQEHTEICHHRCCCCCLCFFKHPPHILSPALIQIESEAESHLSNHHITSHEAKKAVLYFASPHIRLLDLSDTFVIHKLRIEPFKLTSFRINKCIFCE